MTDVKIDFPTLIPKFDAILQRGLCAGVGDRDGQMCIEAAICAALDLPHGDNPSCVVSSVRTFKIRLNDAKWSSPEARAKGLRALGIAQIGSKGIVKDGNFIKRISEQTIRILIPRLFRELFPTNQKLLNLALQCEKEGTTSAADAAASAAASAADASKSDTFLLLSAELALGVLRELKSPGCEWI